jgi:predicted short-subunit dehydrogenase-like oxidoreductase (DUF2520 family)
VVTEFRDRHPLGGELDPTPEMTPVLPACAVVGHGRLGTALAAALRAAGASVDGPLGRGATANTADVVFLAVPDAEIASAAAAVAPGRLVGHCSGATTLAPLHGHPEAFSLHPLMTVTAAGADFTGTTAAIAGTTDGARATARTLATALGMTAVEIPDADRPAYHAAASMASNFLVTLEWAAERVGGLDRAALAPLVRATVDNWVGDGAHAALTGPIARGDEATVDKQRTAVAERAPDLTSLFDALADATRELAGTRAAA